MSCTRGAMGEWVCASPSSARREFNRCSTRFRTPFRYDPRAGNLLLEITKSQSASIGDGPIYVDGTADAPGIALVTDRFGVEPRKGMSVGFVRFVRSSR
jgi:hypothetical protein